MQMHIAIECRRQYCRLAELTGAVGAHLLVSEVESTSTSTSTAARQSGGGPPWAPLAPLAAASYRTRTVQQAAAGGSVLLCSLTAAVDPSYCFHLSKMEATSDGPYGSSCAVFYLFAFICTCWHMPKNHFELQISFQIRVVFFELLAYTYSIQYSCSYVRYEYSIWNSRPWLG